MKKLLKWLVRRYVSRDAIKEYVHAANASLRRNVAVADGRQKVIEVGNDVAELTGVYLSVFADDGRITDDAEEARVNETCDRTVDKYLTDALVDGLLDRIFG